MRGLFQTSKSLESPHPACRPPSPPNLGGEGTKQRNFKTDRPGFLHSWPVGGRGKREWSGVGLNLPRQRGASVVSVRFAAEQRWLIACGETAGHRDLGTKKLRSSDMDLSFGRIGVTAPQLHHPRRRIPKARALGYLPQLLPSQSHHHASPFNTELKSGGAISKSSAKTRPRRFQIPKCCVTLK